MKIAAFCSLNAFWVLLFASPISWFLKFAGVALTVWLGTTRFLALQGVDRAFENERLASWLNELTFRNLLKAIREGRVQDWNTAIEDATREAAADIEIARADALNLEKLSQISGWVYWPGKIIFVTLFFSIDMVLCAIVAAFVASAFG